MGTADNEHNKQVNYNECWKVWSTMGDKNRMRWRGIGMTKKKEAVILNKMTEAGITEKVTIWTTVLRD